jgi:hypothetical protein
MTSLEMTYDYRNTAWQFPPRTILVIAHIRRAGRIDPGTGTGQEVSTS